MDPIYESYRSDLIQIAEGTSATKDYIDINSKDFDSRAIVYLTYVGRAIYDLLSNMKQLDRVLRPEHYRGLKKAIKDDIDKSL